MRIFFTSVCLLVSTLSAALPAGEHWPQFRGPGGQGHSDATGLPARWSEADNVTWKVAVPGKGWSSPVIWGEQIWLTTALDEGHSLRALCFDRGSGKLLHDTEVFHPAEPLPINTKNSYASPTPVIENNRLWVHFGSMGTACVDTGSGQVVWRNEQYEADHKEGPGSSPVVVGDLLVLNFDGRDKRFVVALNKATGEEVWKVDRSAPPGIDFEFNKAYATPLAVQHDGREVLVDPGARRVSAYEPKTGREIWWANYRGFSTVTRPVAGHGMVFVGSGYPRAELLAIKLGGSGDVTDTHVAWRFTRQAPRNPSPLLVGDEVYLCGDRGVATCLDAESGDVRWTQRVGGNYSASPLYADGRIFFFGEQGRTTIIQPGPEYRKLATCQLNGQLMATPAVAGSALFIRTDTHLYRIE